MTGNDPNKTREVDRRAFRDDRPERGARRDTWTTGIVPYNSEGTRATLPPRFYQTKPFVMLKKMHLYGSGRMGCIDYRKMTNGFVFLEMGGRGGPAGRCGRGGQTLAL